MSFSRSSNSQQPRAPGQFITSAQSVTPHIEAHERNLRVRTRIGQEHRPPRPHPANLSSPARRCRSRSRPPSRPPSRLTLSVRHEELPHRRINGGVRARSPPRQRQFMRGTRLQFRHGIPHRRRANTPSTGTRTASSSAARCVSIGARARSPEHPRPEGIHPAQPVVRHRVRRTVGTVNYPKNRSNRHAAR